VLGRAISAVEEHETDLALSHPLDPAGFLNLLSVLQRPFQYILI